MFQGCGQFGEGFGVGVDLIAEHGGRGGRRGQPNNGAAAVPPGGDESPQRGCFAGAGGRDPQLQPSA
jgi:hypothetical protein